MTYDELAKVISTMTPEQKQMQLTIFDKNDIEFFPAMLAFGTDEDSNFPYFSEQEESN